MRAAKAMVFFTKGYQETVQQVVKVRKLNLKLHRYCHYIKSIGIELGLAGTSLCKKGEISGPLSLLPADPLNEN